MRSSDILAGVLHLRAYQHGQKHGLKRAELVHVHGFEELLEALVGKHLAVENVHSGDDLRLSANSFVQAYQGDSPDKTVLYPRPLIIAGSRRVRACSPPFKVWDPLVHSQAPGRRRHTRECVAAAPSG